MELSASPFGVVGLFFSQRPAGRSGAVVEADSTLSRRDCARDPAVGVPSPAAVLPAGSEEQSRSADRCEGEDACSPARLLRLVQPLMAPATRSSDLDSPAEAAAAAFTRAVQEIEAQRGQGSLTNEQSVGKIRAAWDEFENASRMVLLQVVAQPDGCTRQWRPLFGGQWTALGEDGALVGIGVNQVRVSRDGFTPVVENVTTDTDLTKTYRLAPSPD